MNYGLMMSLLPFWALKVAIFAARGGDIKDIRYKNILICVPKMNKSFGQRNLLERQESE